MHRTLQQAAHEGHRWTGAFIHALGCFRPPPARRLRRDPDPINMCEPISATILGAYHLYKMCKTAGAVVEWAQIHDKVGEAEQRYIALQNSRPADPRLAKADGFYDMRRRPAPAQRKAIIELKHACDLKDEGMFWRVCKKMMPGGEFHDIAIDVGDVVEDIRQH